MRQINVLEGKVVAPEGMKVGIVICEPIFISLCLSINARKTA